MSIAAIASSSLSQLQNIQQNYRQVQGKFKELGQDLQAGNLSQAQTDFVTLSQSAAIQYGGNSPIAQTLNTIGQALQSGNLGAAQQAFSSLPTSVRGPGAGSPHAHTGGARTDFQNALNQLSQALQSGNLSTAQQAFSTVQQIWQEVGPTAVPGPSANGSTSSAAPMASAVSLYA